MYTAEGNQLGVYTSTNGINWVPSGKVGPDQFFKGLSWDDKQNMPIECPQLANLKDENDNSHVVLFYGCKDPQNGQTTGTYYVVGHLDSNDDFIADFPAHRLDQGSDYYGANIQQNTLDNPIDGVDGIGWIGNWNYTSAGVYDNQDSQGKMTPHLGSYSLPRVYSLNSDGTLSTAFQHVYTTPTYATGNDDISIDNPIIGIKTEDHSIQVDTDNGQPVYKMYQSNIDGSASHYKFDFSDVNNYSGRVYIKISQGKDYVILNYDPRNGMYRVSRYSSELNNDMQKTVASSYYYDGALGNGLGYSADDGALNNDSTSENTLQDFTIEIYTDQDSIEFVMPNGHVYTCARYGIDKLQRIEVDTSDKNAQLDYDYTTYNGPKYELKDGEETNMGEPGNNTSVVNPKADNSATDNPVMPPANSGSGNSSNSNSGSSTTPSTDKPAISGSSSSDSSSSTTNNSKPDSSTSSSDSNKPADTTNTQPSDSTSSKYQIVINYVDMYHDNKIVGQKVINGTGQYPKSQIETDMVSNIPKGWAMFMNGDTVQTEIQNVKPVDKNGVATYTYTVTVEQPKQSDGQPATKPNDNTGSSSSSTSASKPNTDNKPANSSSSSSSSTTDNSKPDSSTSSSDSNKPSDTTNTKPADSTSTKPSGKPSQGTTTNKPSSSTTGQTSSNSSSSSTTTDHSSQPANNPNDVNHDVNGGSATNSSKPSSSTSSTTNTQKPVNSSSDSSSSTTDSSSSTSTGNQLPDSTSAEGHASSDHETDETGNGSETPNSSTTSTNSDNNNQTNGSSSESSNSTSSTSENTSGTTSTTTNNTSSSNASSTATNSSSSQNGSNDVSNSQSSSNNSSAKTSENSAKKEGSVTTQSTKAIAENGTVKKNDQESNTTANVASNDAQSSVTAQGSDNSKQENSQKLPQTGESNNQELVEIGLEMFGVIATAGVAINKKRYGTK